MLDEDGPSGHYNLGNGYASATGSVTLDAARTAVLASTQIQNLTEAQKKLIRFDPDILAGNATDTIAIQKAHADDAFGADVETKRAGAISVRSGLAAGDKIIRRLTSVDSDGLVTLVLHHITGAVGTAVGDDVVIDVPLRDSLTEGGGLGSVVGTNTWALEEPKPATGNSSDAARAGKN